MINPYCTLEEVQQETRNDEVENDEVFEEAIVRASRFVDEHCNRSFFYREFTELAPYVVPKHLVVAEDKLILPFRIRELVGLKVNDDVLDPTTYDYDEYSAYLLSLQDMHTMRVEMWHEQRTYLKNDNKRMTVTVWGSFGYTNSTGGSGHNPENHPPSDLPSAIRRATILIAAAFSGLNTHDYVDMSGARQNVNDNKIPSEAIKLLEKYCYRPHF
jgi:hypothetical protein